MKRQEEELENQNVVIEKKKSDLNNFVSELQKGLQTNISEQVEGMLKNFLGDLGYLLKHQFSRDNNEDGSAKTKRAERLFEYFDKNGFEADVKKENQSQTKNSVAMVEKEGKCESSKTEFGKGCCERACRKYEIGKSVFE